MEIKYITGDVTKLPLYIVVAHNIDCGEVALGAGVALQLAKKFVYLKNMCKQNAKLGFTYRYVHTDGSVVYNMFTKKHVYYNSRKGMSYTEYLDVQRNCLLWVRYYMSLYNEKTLAIPRIGCGLDGCNWEDIENLVLTVFRDTDIRVLVVSKEEE